jgi:hypothetical protein
MNRRRDGHQSTQETLWQFSFRGKQFCLDGQFLGVGLGSWPLPENLSNTEKPPGARPRLVRLGPRRAITGRVRSGRVRRG